MYPVGVPNKAILTEVEALPEGVLPKVTCNIIASPTLADPNSSIILSTRAIFPTDLRRGGAMTNT